MFGITLIFGVPLTVAAVLLSPQGLDYILNGIVRYSGVVLLLLPFAAWPIFWRKQLPRRPASVGSGRLLACGWAGPSW